MTANSSPTDGQEQLIDKPSMKRMDRHAQSKKNEARINADPNNSAVGRPQIVPTDEALLQWLRQRINNSSPTASLSQLLSSPLFFTPGTLPLSQLSTLQKCYTEPTIYGNHFKENIRRRVPYSEKHQLAYILLPKSGSSTGRFMMKHEFDAVEQYITVKPPMHVIAFVREPLSRFYSQFDEAYVRTAPWVMKSPHPFPYLYENLNSYHDYEDVFCPISTRKNRRECIDRQSKENGTLSSRLERFVQEYDGRSPFDIHLALQVPLLSNIDDGRSLHISELYNTTNAEQDWNAIAKRYLGEEAVLENAKKAKQMGTKESGGVIQGRSYPRRFDKSLVGAITERRICELALLDYCCLNFPLPSVCTSTVSEGGDNEQNLSCKMDYDDEHGRIRIQPGKFPERGK
ncbi:hypothetical protein ACHAXR_005393 [Thalassiosira sp. AJA248-18]